MKPREHYDIAEGLLTESRNVSPDYALYLVAAAQVHATLATVQPQPRSWSIPVRYPDQGETP